MFELITKKLEKVIPDEVEENLIDEIMAIKLGQTKELLNIGQVLDIMNFLKNTSLETMRMGNRNGFITEWTEVKCEELIINKDYSKRIIQIRNYEFNLFNYVQDYKITRTCEQKFLIRINSQSNDRIPVAKLLFEVTIE